MKENKTKYAFFNGKIIPIEDANISIRTCVIHYGTGIFEGINPVVNCLPANWRMSEGDFPKTPTRSPFEGFAN